MHIMHFLLASSSYFNKKSCVIFLSGNLIYKFKYLSIYLRLNDNLWSDITWSMLLSVMSTASWVSLELSLLNDHFSNYSLILILIFVVSFIHIVKYLVHYMSSSIWSRIWWILIARWSSSILFSFLYLSSPMFCSFGRMLAFLSKRTFTCVLISILFSIHLCLSSHLSIDLHKILV